MLKKELSKINLDPKHCLPNVWLAHQDLLVLLESAWVDIEANWGSLGRKRCP